MDEKNQLYKVNSKYTKIVSWYMNNMPTFQSLQNRIKMLFKFAK